MNQNKHRIGNFTSSEIAVLVKEGRSKGSMSAAAATYIEETDYERLLDRSISDESNAKPLTWGKLLEARVFDILGLEYALLSDITTLHPGIDFWAGSPDGKKDSDSTIVDVKCPMTLASFCRLAQPLYDGLNGMSAMNAIRDNHKDGEKFYWQLVSNACIHNTANAELIVYMPYLSELPTVRMMANNVPLDQQSKHYWIAFGNDDELPHLLDGGYYKNLNTIRFEVPEEDKRYLTQKVQDAGKLLKPYLQTETKDII